MVTASQDESQVVAKLKSQAKHCLAKHNFERARDLLTDAISIKDSSYKLYRLRSVAYACLMDYDRSLEDAEAVISLNDACTDGYYHKGFALYHKAKYSAAAHAFLGGLKLNPADSVLRQGFWDAMSMLSQSRHAADKGQEDQDEKRRARMEKRTSLYWR